MNKLGIYWSVEHRRAEDYAYFKALQPSVVKIMDGGAPDYQFVRDNLPDSLVIARDWALSEQMSDMLSNPVGTGQRHAQEWNDHQAKLGFDRAKTLVLGINEPHIWEAGIPEALRLYTISLCLEAKKYGLRVGAMQLSVGWPNNTGPDTPPDWAPFAGVEQAIIENNGALICHEYWADKGPSENWGWWAGRTLKCPWQVPIVIGECGVDMFVRDTSVGQQNRGWLGHMPPERYAAELVEYTNRMGVDPRFVGCCVFASDFQAHEWYSFDVQPAYKAVIAALPTISDTKPVETHLPTVSTGQPVATGDNWSRAWPVTLNIEGGLSTDRNDPGNYRPDGSFVGTKYGISALAHPDVDIVNLTKDQALKIYFDQYWDASGANSLPWPLCLLHFDAFVQNEAAARNFLAASGGDVNRYMAERIDWYTNISNWENYGKGWMRRCATILRQAAA